MAKNYFLIIVFLFLSSNAQEKVNHQFITKSLNDYFSLESENIHLHFNKSVYLTNETIWFKGYVIDKKTNKLNYATTNVYVRIIDENKKEIISQLNLANNGIIIGHFKLDETFTSGKYFIHTYTNFMNNFEEDESAIFPIEIVNIKDKITDNNNNYTEDQLINVSIEGGKLVFDCDNTVGVYIKNCNGKGLKLNNIKVFNTKNELINEFSTNEQGYGKFDLLKTKSEEYKIVVEQNGENIVKKLPLVVAEGISISINNYSDEQKIFLKIKTNEYVFNKHKDRDYTIVIQKNNQANLINFNLKKLTNDIVIDKSILFEGINTIRIIDEFNNSIADRVIYNHIKNKPSIVIEKNITTKDTLFIKGHLKNKIANFSISILPTETISTFENNSIISQFNFNSYLLNKLENISYYFKDYNRKKQFELDLVLLNQNVPKYDWNNIATKTPTIKHTFDVGLVIEGSLNQTLKNPEKYSIDLTSVEQGINLTTNLIDKNKFEFKNILAIDSTTFFISLLKDKTVHEEIKLYSRVTNNKNKFLKALPELKTKCALKSFITTSEYNNDFPYQENTTILKEVELVDVKKEVFTHKNDLGNNASQKFKISKEDEGIYRDVLGFIQAHGYLVTSTYGTVKITSRIISTLNASNAPIINLNGFNLNSNLEQLFNLRLEEIDEIYINKHGFGLGLNGANGVINIYTKKTFIPKGNNSTTLSKPIMIKEGYQKLKNFKNPIYSYYENQAFKRHGTIGWIPNLYTDENGDFEFKIPTLNQDNLLLNIQGIDNEGNFYYENIVIDIN